MKSSVIMDNRAIQRINKDESMNRHLCPKCRQVQAWYEVSDNVDLIQRCLCGYHKVVYTEREDGVVISHVLPKSKANMPRPGTKLSKCLGALVSLPDNKGRTGDVAALVGLPAPDVASQLMVLQHKGLILKVESNRGKTGGSVWSVTKRALEFVRLREK